MGIICPQAVSEGRPSRPAYMLSLAQHTNTRNKLDSIEHQLWALAEGEHLLSTIDTKHFYLNGPPY